MQRRILGLRVLAGLLGAWALFALPGEAGDGVDLLGVRPVDMAVETRRIDFERRDRFWLGEGWSGRHDRDERGTFVWATAEVATLRFDLLEVREQQLLLELFAHPDVADQRVALSVNGRDVGEIAAKARPFEYRWVLPASALRVGENRLALRHRMLAGSGNPDDDRRFAAGYLRLLIGPTCARLRPQGPPPRTGLEWSAAGVLEFSGPAEVTWEIPIPAEATLAVDLELPKKPPGNAAFQVSGRADPDAPWLPLGEIHLAKPFFRRAIRDSLHMPLASVAGERAQIRISATSPACSAAAITLRLKRLQVLAP